MRSALLLISVVALAGCDDLFETNDHDYDFPSSGSSGVASVPTNVQPKPPSGTFSTSSSSSSGFIPGPATFYTGTHGYLAIEASDHYSCGLRAGNQVECWGNTLADQPPMLTDLSGSAKTACGTDPNGALRCWGAAEGFDPPIGGRLSKLGVGDGFACALDDDGHAHCWGPKVIAPPADETLVELAVGTNHACGLHQDGTAVCWGLGKAAEPPKDAIFHGIAAGAATTCAITQGVQAVYCWGVLNGAQATKGGIESVAVTLGKACGIRTSDHQLECWGLATRDWLSPPVDVPFSSVSIGVTHACGIRQDNALAVCWGSDTSGESSPP